MAERRRALRFSLIDAGGIRLQADDLERESPDFRLKPEATGRNGSRASHFALRVSRLARARANAATTISHRAETQSRHGVQREGRGAVCPRGHTGGGRFLSYRGCNVRAHAQLDQPSRGSAPVDPYSPYSPCNPWLKIGLATRPPRKARLREHFGTALRYPSLTSVLRF